MRTLAILLALGACSSSSPPKLTEDVATRLKTIASECTEEHPTPGPPHGYFLHVYCRPSDQSDKALVMAYLLEQNVIGELHLELAEPVETAIPRFEHALSGVVSAKDLATIATALRADLKPEPRVRSIPTKGVKAWAVVERNPDKTELSVRWESDE